VEEEFSAKKLVEVELPELLLEDVMLLKLPLAAVKLVV